MSKSVKQKLFIWIGGAAVVILIFLLLGQETFLGGKTYSVRRSTFESTISVKGEIQGKNAFYISFPDELKHRDLWVREFAIKDLIEEGKVVKQGDWIATLEADNLNQQIQNNNDEIERRLAQFNDQKIDSAIELNQLREELKELRYELEYRELDLEQSQYESPAYQRKMNVAYNKTLRQIEKKRRDYELRKLNLAVRTRRSEDRYNFVVHRDSLLQRAVKAATITAPQNGMVMYARNNWGRKRRIGDNVSQWNPAIASLPDLSVLISETYVEEIHITKLNIGDSVKISVDAIPGKTYNGVVDKIANIGQELPNMESKVFNVIIEIVDSDIRLKPAMTSNNNILIDVRPDVLTIPRQALFTENGEHFVYLRDAGKIFKQPVKPGLENDSEVIINAGLEENDKVLLARPENHSELETFSRIASGK